MNYYYNIDLDNKEVEEKYVKNKFFIRGDPSEDVPGHYKNILTKSDTIENETDLITPKINSKDKTQMKLKNSFHPSDYNLNYENNLRKDDNQKTGFYYNNRDVGPGRGFGNLNISNDIRNGDSSRYYTKEFKQEKEAQQFFDYQFQYLDRNFQDPNHVVMSIPRGGESTRKQNQLSVNTMRNPNAIEKDDERIKTIKFKY
jgi:hypothetical protein